MAADASRGPGRVGRVGRRIGPLVEFVIVRGFIDADAPEDDGGVVPVLGHHLRHIIYSDVLPGSVPDMLPARDFREDEKTPPVTLADEVLGLGIVGCTHCVKSQFFFQNIGVVALHGFRHGVAGIRIGLVAVQAPELQIASV